MSFHVLFLSNEKTEHSSQVFIGKANFSRGMKKLENAGDLRCRQNVRVLCRPISIQGYTRLHMRPFFAILGLLLCFMPAQADELPVIKDSEAVQYIGKNVEVRGLVVSVTTSPLGTACISFGREFPDQTFAGFIAAGSKMTTDLRIATLQGKIVGITGTIELYQGKPQIEVTATDQIKGLNSQIEQ